MRDFLNRRSPDRRYKGAACTLVIWMVAGLVGLWSPWAAIGLFVASILWFALVVLVF